MSHHSSPPIPTQRRFGRALRRARDRVADWLGNTAERDLIERTGHFIEELETQLHAQAARRRPDQAACHASQQAADRGAAS